MRSDHDRSDATDAEAHDPDEHPSREDSQRRFPSIPVSPLGLWPSSTEEDAYRTSHEEAYSDERYSGPTGEDAQASEGIGRFVDEGWVRLFILVGAILFLFPEPATSAIGVLLMGLGVVLWVVERVT